MKQLTDWLWLFLRPVEHRVRCVIWAKDREYQGEAQGFILFFSKLIDDRLYSAVLRSLEQTQYVRMWFYMSV